jgi:(p)ppGpp synthase/HD superfamily hydrolase
MVLTNAKVREAIAFGREAHNSIGHKRKYKVLGLYYRPYYVHTERVANLIAKYAGNYKLVIAALLHDVLEDVTPKNSFYSGGLIDQTFGLDIGGLVSELTDVYTHENYPAYNRKRRKELETFRISQISIEAKTIKLADIYDNAISISRYDPNFARIYKAELFAKIDNLYSSRYKGNPELFRLAYAQLVK